MKIRIQDSSLRLRMTLREVEDFAANGRIERAMDVLGAAGPAGTFRYALQFAPQAAETDVVLSPAGIEVLICPRDRATLLAEHEEGVYVHREWTAPDGAVRRFMVFVEKDRPGSICVKKEQWIYDAPPRGPVETRPIPPRPAQPSTHSAR